MGRDAIIHTRRPATWRRLSDTDAALLDFLRRGGRTSELAPKETADRTLLLFSQKDRFERLLKIADSEPPRVRAILGDRRKPPEETRKSGGCAVLNPLSRFDFGLLAALPAAKAWQSKAARR